MIISSHVGWFTKATTTDLALRIGEIIQRQNDTEDLILDTSRSVISPENYFGNVLPPVQRSKRLAVVTANDIDKVGATKMSELEAIIFTITAEMIATRTLHLVNRTAKAKE